MDPWWRQVLDALRQDFSDLPDAGHVTQVVLRLTVAAGLGGLIGYERERSGKPAGVRTHMLVALGAALFVLVPEQSGVGPGDLTRVLQGVITGIGFLGAGAILKRSDEGHVEGLPARNHALSPLISGQQAHRGALREPEHAAGIAYSAFKHILLKQAPDVLPGK